MKKSATVYSATIYFPEDLIVNFLITRGEIMAFYKYPQFLQQNQHGNFDTLREPSADAPDAGIYRCEVCAHEIGIAKGHKLPPQNHHQHAAGAGPIRWRLIVASAH